MSGLATILARQGFSVRGADSQDSPTTRKLRGEGIEVAIGDSAELVRPDDVLILSDAISLDGSPAVRQARSLGCPLLRRSQAAGWLLRHHRCVCVTGTHGKTTTTAMIGSGLLAAGFDPVVWVGARIPEWDDSVRWGEDRIAVVEACEAYDSLRDFDPFIVVLTNLELDHVDFHGSWEGLKETFVAFLSRVPPEGGLVCPAQDLNIVELMAAVTPWRSRYASFSANTWGEATAAQSGTGAPLGVPGEHNVRNAAAALQACRMLGADEARAIQGIRAFTGAERRLQVLQSGEVAVLDDYAHTPREIEASLQAVRERYLGRRVIVVYQPHLYSRTRGQEQDFAQALSAADHVVLTDIYPAREAPIPGVSSARIAELIEAPVSYIPCRHLLAREVARQVRPGDVVVGMGAGDISEFGPALLAELRRDPHDDTVRAWIRGEGGQPRPRLRIAVACGGDSAEREVSLLSGREVLRALSERGHDAFLFDVSHALLADGDVSKLTGASRPDVAFLCVHGTHAEDGAIQGFFDLLQIPHTGSDIQASALAFDKQKAKELLSAQGIPVPAGMLLTRAQWDEAQGRAHDPDAAPSVRAASGHPLSFHPPAVVKPNRQGSTIGLSFVETDEQLVPAIERAFGFGQEVLVEEWLHGVEISVPVLGDRALPVVEIVPTSGRYDFRSKYEPGQTDEIVPARLTDEQTRRAQSLAVRAHQALRCQGATRTDMIVTKAEIYTLEVNTLPGMTPTSLLPKSAEAAGMSFADLCEWMVRDALARARQVQK
jgi:UDP-N-acetylmuramate--L-alanine ligase